MCFEEQYMRMKAGRQCCGRASHRSSVERERKKKTFSRLDQYTQSIPKNEGESDSANFLIIAEIWVVKCRIYIPRTIFLS